MTAAEVYLTGPTDLNHPETGSDLRRTVTLRLLARAGGVN